MQGQVSKCPKSNSFFILGITGYQGYRTGDSMGAGGFVAQPSYNGQPAQVNNSYYKQLSADKKYIIIRLKPVLYSQITGYNTMLWIMFE